jgi:hypothetical protein
MLFDLFDKFKILLQEANISLMFEKLIVYFSKHNLAYLPIIVILFFYIISFTLGCYFSIRFRMFI